MRRLFAVLVAVFLAGALAAGCGGDKKETKKAPVYPACETNDNCAEHGEFCVDKQCKECGTDANCAKKGPCLACKANKCEARENCCTSDKDCPPDQKCKAKPGKKEGTCGTL